MSQALPKTQTEMRRFLSNILIRLGILLNLLLILYIFRFPLLRGMGNFLTVQDDLEKCDAIYVLSGNPIDRGHEGALLLQQEYAPEVICTGADYSGVMLAYGIKVLHCELTRRAMLQQGADSTRIRMIDKGTSTMEEYEAIKKDIQSHGYKKVMILTSLFHTRRTRQVFKGRLEDAGIHTVMRGADDSGFDEAHWWKHEDGLLFLNSEYIKMAYYWVKY
jgi:uncharacterized SAM-binding protein YcdF (DUF218 family)